MKDGLDPFDRMTLKNLGVVFDNDGVVIASDMTRRAQRSLDCFGGE